jgi:hypothetical protein
VKIINTTAFILALLVTLGYYFFSVRKWKAKKEKMGIDTKIKA